MSENEMTVWGEALRLVPVVWIGEFTRLLEEGEASDDFIRFFEHDANCQRAFEMILRADQVVSDLVTGSADDVSPAREAS